MELKEGGIIVYSNIQVKALLEPAGDTQIQVDGL